MTTLKQMLDRLDLARYHDAFVDEGFDTWEILMDITESDLASKDRTPLPLLLHSGSRDECAGQDDFKKAHTPRFLQQRSQDSQDQDAAARNNNPPPRNKRKYRRHPKVGGLKRTWVETDAKAVHPQADEHAPERPPSAYVIFSNRSCRPGLCTTIRDQLKGRELSFTEIAKLVGERWQELQAHEKEPCEREAQTLKDKYYSELKKYKKTPQYKQYQDYLVEFKAKHSGEGSTQGQGQGQGQDGGPDPKKIKLRSTQSRSYDETNVDGDDGVDGMDGADRAEGDDGMDGIGGAHNQAASPSERVQHSPTYSSPTTKTYRQFPLPRETSDAGTASSYSTWPPAQHTFPTSTTSLHRHSTNSTLRSDHALNSPTTSHPALPTHTSAPSKPTPKLPSLNQLNSIASRKSSDTPLLNWPLHTTLPPLDPRAMTQRSGPNSLYSPTTHHVIQPAPSLHTSPSLPMKDSLDLNSQNKASLSTLLRATEHVERDRAHSADSSVHKQSR
ncbi:unnamed protein product, partial [Aureobasidium vineae]